MIKPKERKQKEEIEKEEKEEKEKWDKDNNYLNSGIKYSQI